MSIVSFFNITPSYDVNGSPYNEVNIPRNIIFRGQVVRSVNKLFRDTKTHHKLNYRRCAYLGKTLSPLTQDLRRRSFSYTVKHHTSIYHDFSNDNVSFMSAW